MALFIPIKKIDEEQRLVYGTLCAETADKTGEILDYDSAVPQFKKWSEEAYSRSKGKSKGNVREMHGSTAAGIITDLDYDAVGKTIQGCAKVVDDQAWEKVKTGTYTGFSIGGGYARRWVDPHNPDLMRYTPTLAEVSLVDNPCVPTATFDVIKKDGSVELRKFISNSTAKEAEPMSKNTTDTKATADELEFEQVWRKKGDNGVIGANKDEVRKAYVKKKAEEMAKSTMDSVLTLQEKLNKASGEEKDEEDGVKKGGDHEAPAGTGVTLPAQSANAEPNKEGDGTVKKDAVTGESPAGTGVSLPAQSANAEPNTEGKGTVKKTETLDGESEAGRAEGANSANAAPNKEGEGTVKVAKKDKDDEFDYGKAVKVKKKDYSKDERKEMADAGHAMPDGSYPIKDKGDLEDAVEAFGRAKNKPKVKAHIKSRAKDLGHEDTLPDHWKGAEKSFRTGQVKKGLCEVAETAHLLHSLGMMHERIEMEQRMEGDTDSDQADKAKALIGSFIEFLKDQVDEETSELLDTDEDVEAIEIAGIPIAIGKFDSATILSKVLSAQVAKRTPADLKKSAVADEVNRFKKAATLLEKAGRTHSAETLGKLQDVHDGIHKCMKSMNDVRKSVVGMGADDSHIAAELGEDQGVHAHKATLAELRKVTNALEDSNIREETLVKMFGDLGNVVGGLNKKMDEVLASPQAGKGVLRGAKVLSKSEDDGYSTPEKSEASLMKSVEKMSDGERQVFLMKAARMNPMKE